MEEFVGHLAGEVSNSYNLGKIISSETKTYKGTGGIVGGSIGSINAKIINCFNLKDGIVQGKNNTGGIIGYIRGNSTENIKIVNCYNSANMSSGTYIGGIVGSIYGASSGSTNYSEIINCYNSGKISSGTCIGGITGSIGQVSGATLSQYIANCFNGGEVSQIATNSGEFIGKKSSTSTLKLDNCYYLSTNINSVIGSGTATGTAEPADIDTNLISLLNNYVTTYNSENESNEDFIKLNEWQIDESTGEIKLSD